MAYPYYQNYPNYNQMYLQQQLQSMQQPQQPQPSVQTAPQIQNGGFVVVKDINEAMNYPVALGNSVTFKNETQPYIYTKTLGFSQLDQPIFEVFKLVKEEKQETVEAKVETSTKETSEKRYLAIEEADLMKNEINELKREIEALKGLVAENKKEVASA